LTGGRFVSTLPLPVMTCPRCLQDAPTIVRGVRAYCTACGAPRPLATVPTAVNVAGQPARVGGGVAGVLGKVALVTGLLVALVLGSLANAIFPAATLGFWLGGVISVLTLMISLPLIFGGRRLRRSGESQIRAAQEQAVFGLAAQRRGVLIVRDVALALSLEPGDADALLTSLAKRPDAGVALDVDDNGALSYRFVDLVHSTPASRVRVAEQPWAPPVRVAPAAPAPRIIDAELIEDEEALAVPAPRRATR
jgi:hypothetical protein